MNELQNRLMNAYITFMDIEDIISIRKNLLDNVRQFFDN